jgi:hypothetical protein
MTYDLEIKNVWYIIPCLTLNERKKNDFGLKRGGCKWSAFSHYLQKLYP